MRCIVQQFPTENSCRDTCAIGLPSHDNTRRTSFGLTKWISTFRTKGLVEPIAVGAFTWRPCWTVWQRMTEMKHFCFWTKRLAATDRRSAWAHGGLSFHLAPLQNSLTRMIGMCIEGALMPTSHQTTVLWHKSNGSYARLINLGWLWSIGCSWAATVKIEIKPSCTACTHISAADKGSIEEVAVWLHSWRNERVCPCTWVVHSSHTHTRNSRSALYCMHNLEETIARTTL